MGGVERAAQATQAPQTAQTYKQNTTKLWSGNFSENLVPFRTPWGFVSPFPVEMRFRKKQKKLRGKDIKWNFDVPFLSVLVFFFSHVVTDY